MAKYNFTTSDRNELIPVANEDFFTGAMNDLDQYGECYLVFYDENEEVVTPDSGTIEFTASPIEGQYHAPSEGASIDASTVGPDATYTPPTFNSIAVKTRMRLIDIVGATYVKAFHWRTR